MIIMELHSQLAPKAACAKNLFRATSICLRYNLQINSTIMHVSAASPGVRPPGDLSKTPNKLVFNPLGYGA